MDWNNNGKQDPFDTFMDMKVISGNLDVSNGKQKSETKGGRLIKIEIILFILFLAGVLADALH